MVAVQDDELSTFRVPEHLVQCESHPPDYLHDAKVGVIIFSSRKDHVLLLKTSETASHPNTWEYPGGSIELDVEPEHIDESIIHAAVRECREVTQLHISNFIDVVRDQWIKGNQEVRKFIFIVNVHDNQNPEPMWTKVGLNPAKHQAFLWAERAMVEGMDEDMFFPKQKQTILDSFEFVRNML
ncbi:hypothetical protein BGW36DRAFT_410429 [Talaromyces proteolyticus]|uniref:Nudix hydrolase domain-containing protein n=1 Tax=Talaromyces proteolyticus TaxID=1131652 RepID=A0AAD4KN46_9EURO|nr:uncharacterized protein BGW36DRAFT_410429 [Talaromyces proteolyticus]KAH8691835.1 hypothetical protein BGW36DRAFT_410429 [Talaromyces proteolyticus]